MIDPAHVEEIDKLEDQLSEVESKTLRAEYDLNNDVELPLTEEEKGEWRQNQKAFSERVTKHLLNQQKAFAIIIGQCTQGQDAVLHPPRQTLRVVGRIRCGGQHMGYGLGQITHRLIAFFKQPVGQPADLQSHLAQGARGHCTFRFSA